jgi:hypothetical protein
MVHGQLELVEAPKVHYVPKAQWVLQVYVRYVWMRRSELLSQLTTTTGTILKMDSTKKIIKKLAGHAKGSALWVTSVSNHLGQVLNMVMTPSESEHTLQSMTQGLVKRFEARQVPPPRVLYVDRSCCDQKNGSNVYKRLFAGWDGLEVRMDIWHLLKRFEKACVSSKHLLYARFMPLLSEAFFQWDAEDYQRVLSTLPQGTTSVPRKLLLKHCKRNVRSPEEIELYVGALLDGLRDVTDLRGQKLIDDRKADDIWATEKRHLHCVQDVPGVELYTIVGYVEVNGVKLPVYRCARGSSSLESLHVHLFGFIPGTSASPVAFQAYLLDGIVQWNNARLAETNQTWRPEDQDPRFHSPSLEEKLMKLKAEVLGTAAQPTPQLPGVEEYTGEVFGAQFLLEQTTKTGITFADVTEEMLPSDSEDDSELSDKGLAEHDEDILAETGKGAADDEEDEIEVTLADSEAAEGTKKLLKIPSDDQEALETKSVKVVSHLSCHGGMGYPMHNPGWMEVLNLAEALLARPITTSFTKEQEDAVCAAYGKLHENDLKKLEIQRKKLENKTNPPPSRFFLKQNSYMSYKNLVAASLPGCYPAFDPKELRLTEALLWKLTHICKESRATETTRYRSKEDVMHEHYELVRQRIFSSARLQTSTNIFLLRINSQRIRVWQKVVIHNEDTCVAWRNANVEQQLQLIPRPTLVPGLPEAVELPEAPAAAVNPAVFPDPVDTTGRAQYGRPSTDAVQPAPQVVNNLAVAASQADAASAGPSGADQESQSS